MKILMVTTISNTLFAFLMPQIRMLKQQGHQIDVAFRISREVPPEIAELGCKVFPIPFQRSPLSKKNIAAYKEIHKILETGKYDLVHVHTPVASLLTRLASRKLKNTKMMYTAHGFHFFRGADIKNWLLFYPLERIASRWTDLIVTINSEDYDAAKKFKLRQKEGVVHVNGVGIDLSKYHPQDQDEKSRLRTEYGYSQDEFLLIYAGEMSYRKHQDMLIKVIHQLISKIPNIRLLLAGEGEKMDEYKKMASDLGVQQNVQFLGFRKDIDNLMQMSDVAVSTSRQEGLPVNVMEAMGTGLPLVVSDCRGNRDLVRNGSNGYVVSIDDVETFANSILKIYESPNLRKDFYKQNLLDIQNYGVENVMKEMKVVYSRFK